MLISFKEIKKYPYTYIENIISQKFENNLNPTLLQYGPYLAMRYDIEKYNESISYIQNGMVKMLFDIADIIKFFNIHNKTVSDSKKFLINKLRSLPVNSEVSLYTTSVKILCEKFIEELRSYQYANKLMESSMLNYSPIVPYNRIIKQPNLTESFSNSASNNENPNLNGVISILKRSDKEIEEFIKSVFISNTNEILCNCDKFIKPDSYVKEYNIKDDIKEKKLSPDMITLLTSENKLNLSIVYFSIVYIYYTYQRSDYLEIIDTLSSLDKVIRGGESFKTAMEVMSYFDLPSIEDSLLDIDISENMEYENDKKISQLMNMADIEIEELQSKKYKLDKLLAYLYNSSKYKTDSYTNSLFLNDNESIEGYSYIENGQEMILICEIDSKTLCIPVIDLSDNYKMKLITIDKDENIVVSSDFKSKK